MRPPPALPPLARALFDPSAPFTPRTLELIRARLAEQHAGPPRGLVDPWTARLEPKGNGGVLAPLLNVDERCVPALFLCLAAFPVCLC